MKEFDCSKWDNKPREMWVWDNNEGDRERRFVVYCSTGNNNKDENYPVKIVDKVSGFMGEYKHCAEIEQTGPKCRPFRNCDELIKAYLDNCYKKQMSPNPNNFINEWIELPTIWVLDNKNGIAHSITDYDLKMNSPNCIKINGDWEDLEFLFKYCSFLDGSVCGVEE